MKATDEELVWLYRQTKQLKFCQPLGDFKVWHKRLGDRREKVVRVRVDGGSELMRVKKGKRGGTPDDNDSKHVDVSEDNEDEKSMDDAPGPASQREERESSGPATNIVIGLSLPQWRHTPWAEPMIMVQNYNAKTLSLENGYFIREWQRDAREWWNAAAAPSPEDALEVARVALSAVELGLDMSSDDICEAAEVARYIVHTCSPTVPDIESELDSIPYIQPGEPVFEEQEPPRLPSIQEILDKPNSAYRLQTISDQADQLRRMAELRLREMTKGDKAEARKALERDFPTGSNVIAKMMASANVPPPPPPPQEDENHRILMEMFEELRAA